MAITTAGKNAVMEAVFAGATLALGTMSSDGNIFTELSTDSSINPGYTRMPIVLDNASIKDYSTSTLYVSVMSATATNTRTAYFGDADDGKTPDSLEVLNEGGWTETPDAIAVYRGSTLYYACKFTDTPVNVYQGHRIKITAGKFSVTFNPVETSEDNINIAALNVESDITVETENNSETG